jgi:signal transduction histidine kinase/CheY-like chemotaxis protein
VLFPDPLFLKGLFIAEAIIVKGRPPSFSRRVLRHPAIVPVVLSLGVVLSVISFSVLRAWERAALKQSAEEIAREQVDRLQVLVLRSMEALHSVASLHGATGRFDRREFRRFVQPALDRQPELLALSWDPVVPATLRREYESAAAADGLRDFHFREADGEGRLTAALDCPAYVPVYFIEPLERNLGALGYDLSSDPERRMTLERARDTGQPVASAAIQLKQRTNNGAGFLVVLPVYHYAVPRSLGERREQLDGFAIAVFSVSDLVGGSFAKLKEKGIDAWLLDESGSRRLIFANNDQPAPLRASGSPPEIVAEIPGRQWAVRYRPGADFMVLQKRHSSWIVLFAGLALSGLTSAYLYGAWRWAGEIAATNAILEQEMTVRKNAEAAADQANQAKSEFLASMSHEIRTPLNAILGYTQLMQRDPDFSPEQHDIVRGINASGHHLLGLINEILDLAKIEAGRMELQLVDFDLTEMGKTLAATFRPLCAQKRIGFRLNLDVAAARHVRGDEGKLRQTLINLLGNAVKFTGSGEICLGFTVLSGDRWRFEVVDTGLGIPDDEQSEIFKPFYQCRTAQHQGGTGLGLAIAQRQVELLGGRLELESCRGVGSRFYFEITIPGAQPAGVAVVPRVLRLKTGSKVRALVVDDRLENARILGQMLSQIGCEVALAGAGAEASLIARQFQPDMAFIDLLMPEMDGAAAARALLSDPQTSQLKIVAHSAAALAGFREAARQAGCVDFLAKPIRAEEVYECLRKYLGVEFDYAPQQAEPSEDWSGWDSPPIHLPHDLCSRLTTAAELHSSTALKLCLQELRQLGPEAVHLAEHIRHLMRSYDMDSILRLMSAASSPVFSEPSSASPHGLIST